MADKDSPNNRHKYRLLYLLEAWLEAPMFLLALIWIWLFYVELTRGLTPAQELWGNIIWLLFILEFLVKLAAAPYKLRYVTSNLLTAISLLVPALRVFRLARALTILRTARFVSVARFVRALSSTNRLVKDIREAQGEAPEPEMNVGLLLACSPSVNTGDVGVFARQLAEDVKSEIASASGIPWVFHQPRLTQLSDDTPRRPSDFLDEASRHLAEGPFDLVIVVTDVTLISRKKRAEPGLSSPATRLVVISADALTRTSREQAPRPLGSPAARFNGAALLLHLLGHLSGLRHARRRESDVMRPFVFGEHRQSLPRFSEAERKQLRLRARRLPERELRGGGPLGSLVFHVMMMLRHPAQVIRPLLEGRAFLMSLSLPGLATAALAPTFLLVFTAEIWDVGVNMDNRTAVIFALASILSASFYLVRVQSLFLPRRDRHVVTEHLAVANGVIYASILLACIGLFFIVLALMLLIQLYIFPDGLMQTWPTLEHGGIDFTDQLRLAAFISTVGVTTGALAGGLESRAVIQHIALFDDEP